MPSSCSQRRIAKQSNSAGFTIIELMVATSVFSIVLLLCSLGIIQVGRTYYKGIVTARTQERARAVSTSIGEAIKFGADYRPLSPAGDSLGMCVGNSRYSWRLQRTLTDNSPAPGRVPYVLVKDGCNGGTTSAQNLSGASVNVSEELMAPRMRLGALRVQNLGDGVYSITVTVMSGDNDMFEDLDGDGNLDACRLGSGDSQYCVVSTLTTVVKKRVNG